MLEIQLRDINSFNNSLGGLTPILSSGSIFIKSLKNIFGGILALFLVILAFIPLHVILIYFLFKLKSTTSKKIQLNPENYKRIKIGYATLNEKTKDLQKFQSIKFPLAFILVKWILKAIILEILNVKNQYSLVIENVNNDYPKTPLNILIPIDDNELWNNRPNSYEYVL
jgi:hypothetical protein